MNDMRDREPRSFWQATVADTSVADELPTAADVAVVGGGLLGASAAYWLARAGAAAALIERDHLAAGATGRNGGFVVAGTAEAYPGAIARLGHPTARDVWKLTLDSRALLRQALEEEAISCDYREPGHMHLALNEGQRGAAARTVVALRADGFAAELLDRQQAQALIGTPLGSEIAGGLFVPEDGLLNPAQLVSGLALAARRRGARLCCATAVISLAADERGVLIETTRGRLRTGAAIVATNAWTSQVLPALAGLITPVRGQVLCYAPAAPVFRLGMGAAATPTGEYWQQALDGTIVLGGCRAIAPELDVAVREQTTTADVQAELEGLFPRLFPDFGGLRVARRWAGLMAFTPDYLPIADRAPGMANVWVVGGFCGHGMPFGMRFGQLLAAAATTGAAPAALAPFRLERPTLVG